MKRAIILAVLVVSVGIGGILTLGVGDDRVTARAEPTTRLYVRTVPPGAAVKIDGKQSGTSDQLFQMPAGAKRVLVEVELDGRDEKKEVIVRGGRITRVEFDLQPPSRETVDPRRSWGPEQATGAPDSLQAGDKTTAWASFTQDEQREWLLLDYAKPVRAKEIQVYESFNPGALSKITAFDVDGKENIVWQLPYAGITVDTTKGYPGIESTVTRSRGAVMISKFPVKVDFPIQRIKLYLDSPRVKG